MLELLGGNLDFEPDSERVPLELISKLDGGFKEVDGCIVPSSFRNVSPWPDRRQKVDNIDDETGFECSLSKVHVEDYLPVSRTSEELARIGVAYANFIRRAVIESHITGVFRIVVAVELADGSANKDGCTVRFHKVRPHQFWLDDDLEHYQEEAIFAMDFESAIE